MRVAEKAAANAIATAAATAVAAAMATTRDGCVGGLVVAATAAGTMTARDDGQQQHSTPPFRPCLVVKCLFSAGSHSFPTKPSALSWNTCGRGLLPHRYVPRPYRGSQSTQYVTAILAKTKSILTI